MLQSCKSFKCCDLAFDPKSTQRFTFFIDKKRVVFYLWAFRQVFTQGSTYIGIQRDSPHFRSFANDNNFTPAFGKGEIIQSQSCHLRHA
jgi:hypothetical protein